MISISIFNSWVVAVGGGGGGGGGLSSVPNSSSQLNACKVPYMLAALALHTCSIHVDLDLDLHVHVGIPEYRPVGAVRYDRIA